MTYTKPQITVLGDAARVIETILKPGGPVEPGHTVTPAYDLDE